jgi:ubiquinone/menaquinone biosynthesis C-methylase UbiE
MKDTSDRVCPVEKSGLLDNSIRRWLQDPQKILKPYIEEGMTVLDIGCGPGFFSIDAARMVGKCGRVIAADLQEGMLQKLRAKIQGTEVEERISLHKCAEDRIGVKVNVDFVIAFWMVHEVPDQEQFFREIRSILNTNGQVLIVEPSFHISKAAFKQMIGKAYIAGFTPIDGPKALLGRTVIMKKSQ